MRVVHALAYNDTKEGTEENAELDLLVVPIWARLPKHVWPFDSLKLDRSRSSTNKFRGAPTSSGINPAGGRLGQAALRPDPFPKVFRHGSEEAISKTGRGITLNLSRDEQRVSCRRLPAAINIPLTISGHH